MAQPLKVGVVGLGMRGFWISELARTNAETELVAMADMDASKLDIAREHFPDVALYSSGEEMANAADVEAVFVGTSDRFHATNAREALGAGKHVLIEKPLAQSFDDLRTIARLKKESGLTVGTFLEMRLSKLSQRVKDIIDSGEIGEVLSASLVNHVGRDRAQFFGRARTRSRDAMVSLVLQKGVHGLDLLNWCIGSSPRRVQAMGALRFFGATGANAHRAADLRCRDCDESEQCPHSRGLTDRLSRPPIEFDNDDSCVWSSACDVEDVTFTSIEYASGAVASYSEIHVAPYYGLHFTFYGSKAQLDVEANTDTGETWVEITERYGNRNQRRERPIRDVGHSNADPALVTDFACAVREGREPLADLRAGFESAAIGIAVRQAIDTGATVELPRFEEA